MDPNQTGIGNLTAIGLAQGELIEEYEKLLGKYRQLKEDNEGNQQKIYGLRRNCETALAAEAFLSQELELVATTHSEEIGKIQQKHSAEIENVKRKCSVVTSQNACLEQKVQELDQEVEALRKKVDELENAQPKEAATSSSSSMERELKLAKENLELLAKVDQFQEKVTNSIMSIAERDRQIDILKEQIECLEENLQAKRDEIEEKVILLESTQDRMMEMSAELAMFKSTPENANRKGNSLFAEVDDQRQEMKKILAAQKKHYLQMKKCYNESEQEIRRLKRENAAMCREIQICTNIFLSADKLYKEKLNERISQLLNQNEMLEKKLLWTQEKLAEVSNDKGINWLDSMLEFCKSETKEIKEQLRSCRIQKGILDENLRNAQQDLAKWRFEALKSRCVIIKRETLLEENNIPFKPLNAYDFNITEKECINAKPKILFDQQNDSANKSPETKRDDVDAAVDKLSDHKLLGDTIANIKTEEEDHQDSNRTTSASDLNTTPITTLVYKQTLSTHNENDSNLCIYSDINTYNASNHSLLPKIECSVENDNIDINENTTQIMSAIKSALNNTDISLKNNLYKKTPFKKQPEGFQNESENSSSFEIFEDTIYQIQPNLPTGNSSGPFEDNVSNVATSADSKDLIKQVQNDENKSPTSKIKLVYTEQLLQIPPQSILVKKRNIFNDLSEKQVTFSPEYSEIKDQNIKENKIDAKRMRPKSNVVVKRIVVKSNFNKK